MTTIHLVTIVNTVKDAGKKLSLTLLVGMENRTATLENNWAVSYEIKRIITMLLLLLLSRFSRV